MAHEIRNKKNGLTFNVTNAEWERYKKTGIDKKYTIVKSFDEKDMVKKPFVPKEVLERRSSVEKASAKKADAQAEKQKNTTK